MKTVLKYLFQRPEREKLPRLSHTLTSDVDPSATLDPDIQLILMTGRVRDPVQARRLMQEYGATNGVELLKRLPPPPPVDWKRRFRAWMRQLEGSYQSDPHRADLTRRR